MRPSRQLAVLLSAAVVAVVALSACGKRDALAPEIEREPLLPDTGSMGLTPVAAMPLFALVDESEITDAEALRLIAVRRSSPINATVRVARMLISADSLAQCARVVAIDVNTTRRLVYVGREPTRNTPGVLSWSLDLTGGRNGWMTAALTEKGMTASVRVMSAPGLPGAQYNISPIGGGYHTISYLDPRPPFPID